MDIPQLNGKELFNWLIANKATLIAQKKFDLKRADAFSFSIAHAGAGKASIKAPFEATKDELIVTSIINTTYLYDSHGDVHIDGLWKKSLSENKDLYLLQEHSMTFEKIIADEVKAYTKQIDWRALGVNVDGQTQALVFESKVMRDRNPYMHSQYSKGYVKQHSVGMRYVSLDMAINDDDYPAYKAYWDKYIDKVANKAEAEAAGYFWAVTEAKAVEGSAVPLGSNWITPTESVKDIQPPAGTEQRAAKSTRRLDALLKLQKQFQQ